MTTPTKDRSWVKTRAGRSVPELASRQKQTAAALGVSQQLISRWGERAPKILTDLYEWIQPLALDERTSVTPLGWDLIRWGIECKLGDLDTSALMREAVIRMHRTDEYAALEAKAIAQLLAERGLPTPEGP